MAQIAIITHNSVTATIQTTSLRSSDNVLWCCLHVSLVFASVSESADELLVLKIYISYMYQSFIYTTNSDILLMCF